MSIDTCIQDEQNWFRYRTGGIILHENKILFIESEIDEYLYMIGGGVHLGETSKDCIEREVYEETGIKAKADRLVVVCENFFRGRGGKTDGLDCHTIEFYYLMKVESLEDLKKVADNGEKIQWVPVDKIDEKNIKPAFIRERMQDILNERGIIHVIEQRDR